MTTRNALAGLALLVFTAVGWAGSAPFVKLLGDRLPVGAEMVVVVDSLQIGEYRILLSSPDGGFEVLDEFAADRTGEYIATIVVPEVAAGVYSVDIDNLEQVIASSPFEVLPALSLDVSPQSAYGGQSIAFQLDGVQPGQVTITADGVPVQGPLDVDQDSLAGRFIFPGGTSGSATIEARNFFGSRTLGSASISMERIPSTGDAVSVISAQIPDGPLLAGETFTVTGQIQMPDGIDPREAKWTLVWIRNAPDRADSRSYPINTRPVAMDADGNFTATAAAPSVLTHGETSQFDILGLLYELPKHGNRGGGSDQVALGGSPSMVVGPHGLCSNALQTLTVQVDDGDGLLIEEAIVSIETGAYLYSPEEAETPGGFSRAPSGSTTTAFAVYDTVMETQLQAFGASPTGCPHTLSHGETDENGEFSFSFSPSALSILYEVAQLDFSSGSLQIRDVDPNVRFSVRTYAGHLGFGPDNQTADGVTGKRFDFSFDASDCQFRFAETLGGPFDQIFDPNVGPFGVSLPPNNKPIKINSNPRVEGLSHTIVNDTVIIEGLRTFHGLDTVHNPNDYLISVSPTRFELPYNAEVFGSLGQVEMFINGQSVGFMSPDTQDTCDASNFDYVLDVPGLHLTAPGTYNAEIVAQRQDAPGEPATKDFQIEIEPVNGWFDRSEYQHVIVDWKPEKISITAFENEQCTDASSDDPALDEHQIGPLDNDNKTQAPRVSQILLAGQGAGAINRLETPETTFAGQSETQTASAPRQACPEKNNLSRPMVRGGTTYRDELFNRGSPFFGSHDPLTLFETGKIPLFRYAWGASPLAAATFGADFWFLLQLTYFGYVDIALEDEFIKASAFVEPAVLAGLDVFFDLSILFGLASATVSATPSINVGMPILVYKNQFISEESGPCFKFLLDVAYKLTLGFCDLCIEAKDTANLLDISEPSNCQITGVGSLARAAVENIPVADKTGVSFESSGDGLTISAAADGIYVNRVAGPFLLQQWQLSDARGAMRPAIAHLGLNSAVAVWSQSGLSEEDFDALVMNPVDGETFGGFAAGSQAQHMVYSVFNGQDWSAPAILTMPSNTGEGDVILTACPKEDPDCPTDGEILAVWARDMAGDMDQQQFKLMYAFFDGTGWTAPAIIDPGSNAKDVQPTADYVNGEPVVMWVRNPSASATAMNMHNRQLWYQFLDQAAGPLQAANLPQSVASPSLSSFSNGTLVAAFTASDDQAQDDRTFLGPKRALWTSFGTGCMDLPAGECFWGGQQREDVHGRKIYVERPQLVIDENDNATVAFRQFGFSGLPLPEEDAIGTITGTGDLATLQFQFETEFSQVGQMSNDGLVNWEVSSSIVPGAGAIAIINGKAGPSVGQLAFSALNKRTEPTPHGVLRRPLGGAAARGTGSDTRQLFISQSPRLPDLAITQARSDTSRLEPGALISVAVEVANLGVALPEDTPVLLSATWFGGYGIGQEGTELFIDNITIGERTSVEFELNVPEELKSDERRSLFVTINPLQTIGEVTAANNVAEVVFGALPVPSGLTAYGNGTEPFNYLDWDAVDDGRVTAYRIYRRDSSGNVEAIGSSPVAGFADILLNIHENYEYQITSMSDRLIESEPSEWIGISRFGVDLIFFDRFESSQ